MPENNENKKEKKKKGLFRKAFGLKSKDEKRALEAAEKAAKQQQLDDAMAARMAAINAAALKSARQQDESAGLIDPEEQARIEQEERRKAELQAQEDVKRAKALAEEKRAAQQAHIAEQARLEAERIEAERLEAEKAEAEKKAEQARARQAEREEQAKLDKEAADAAEKQKQEQERAQLRAAEAEKKAEIERRAALEAQEKAKAQAQAKAEIASQPQTEPQTEPQPVPPQAKEAPAPRQGFLQRISGGLRKSTSKMSNNVTALFNKRKLDDAALEELEDLLISADFGVGPATQVTALLAKDKFDKQISDMEVKIALADVISNILTPLERPLELKGGKPEIMLFVGVNGSGKTTTLGKLAKRYSDQGKKVLIVAGDTFRAAADQQLAIWAERAGAPMLSGKIGSDAAGLVYDAIEKARAENFDIVMIDTAGRLQNRTELMDELAKIVRVINKQDASAPHHTILVLDATVGQNALSQTQSFRDVAGVTGLIMTKLDGTAKGGVLVALSDKFKLPIHYIGIGERIEDLENFSAPVFAAALSGVADSLEPEGA